MMHANLSERNRPERSLWEQPVMYEVQALEAGGGRLGRRKYMPGPHYVVLGLVGALLLLIASALPAQAQGPTSFRVHPQPLHELGAEGGIEGAAIAGAESTEPKRIIIDTDPGVDDVAALAWALLQDPAEVDILGIVATAGNTTVENAARNALIVRQLAGRMDVPVFMGERKPLVQQLSSTGKLIHGIDGVWSAANSYPQDLNQVEREAGWRFYCRIGRTQPGATIVALGPLTNVGRALRSCRNDMRNFADIIVLGGARFGGNTTPVAEFNIWQDPEAAELVFNSGLDVTLVPLDTFTSLNFTVLDSLLLASSGGPLAQFLGCPVGTCADDPVGALLEELGYETIFELFAALADPNEIGPIFEAIVASPLPFSPLGLYIGVQLQAGGNASVPDLAAMMYALDPSLGEAIPALVKVMLRPELVRGQTIIGTGVADKITMIADDRELSRLAEAAYASPTVVFGVSLPDEMVVGLGILDILSREPDNVMIVTSIQVDEMRDRFFATLLSQSALVIAGADGFDPATLAPPIPQLFAPVLEARD